MPNFIKVHHDDNLAVAIKSTSAGQTVQINDLSFCLKDNVASGHKVAIQAIEKDKPVLKFGQTIGLALRDISIGEHIHTHNLSMPPAKYTQEVHLVPPVKQTENATFNGYIRDDGSIGTRNYIGILTSVNCSASVAKMIADHFTDERLKNYPNVDGVVAFTHKGGCGMAAKDSEGLLNLQRTIAGYAKHPNFSHVLILGLGCEVNQIQPLLEKYQLQSANNLKWMTIQDQGGTRKTLEKGIKEIEALLPSANECQRQPCPISAIKLALQCGGSDGYSGITANPALGAASDLLVQHGGTVILSETPEVFGAEHLLTNRVTNIDTANRLIKRLAWWQAHANKHEVELNNNPSPGNQKGGLTTILEKSLGAVAKAGTSPLTGFYHYAESISNNGFVFMDAPGYDPCSITGEIAAGANMVCFTTGRGSVFGAKPAPSLKLASNTRLFERMNDDMDINCGKIIDGSADVQSMGHEIFQQIIAVASGQKTKSEQWGFGDNEFIPWQIGAML